MFATTETTAKAGGELANEFLAAADPVRAVIRDNAKGVSWAAQGCAVALVRMEEPRELAAAFANVEGVIILPPS